MTKREMLPGLTPLASLPSLWELGKASGVSRDELRSRLGEPIYVERDASATYGGEEDWWGYQTPDGTVVAICLRVPYGDAMMCVSEPTSPFDWERLRVMLDPWPIERFDPRRC